MVHCFSSNVLVFIVCFCFLGFFGQGDEGETGVFKLSLIKDHDTLEQLTGAAASDAAPLDLDSILSRERSDSEFSDNEAGEEPG